MTGTPELDVLPGGLREAADRLGIGHRRMYRLAKKGNVPFAIRLGWGYVVPIRAWDKFLANGGTLTHIHDHTAED